MYERLIRPLGSELGEVGVAQPVPLQRIGVTSRNGRKITAGPDKILVSLK